MHKSRWLKRLTGFFVREFLSSQQVKFLIDQRQQFVRSLDVSPLNGVQYAGQITHVYSPVYIISLNVHCP